LYFYRLIHLGRKELVKIVKENHLKCQIIDTEFWGGGLPLYEYKIEMLNSKFVLCPSGSKQETFRFYETLEAGAIPITIYDGFMKAFPSGPLQEFIMVDWSKLPQLMLKINNMTSEQLNQKQKELMKWWRDYVIHQQLILQQKLDRAIGEI